MAATDVCTCGHQRDAHAHFRPGTDCALCPPHGCDRFTRADGLVVRLRRRLTGPRGQA